MTDDDQQPLTLDEWLERQRVDFAAQRVQAHADLDALLDEQWATIAADRQRIDRDISGMTPQ